MLIFWHGHSEFLLVSAGGYRVLLDPFDPAVGYPMRDVRADAVLTSHGHGDHSYVHKAVGSPIVISNPGEVRLDPQVSISAILADHDGEHGAKRGKTLLSVIEMDGLRIAHLGDIGTMLTDEQRKFLRRTDILLLPVGGFYTVDGREAADIVRAVRPAVTVPMHYKTEYNQSWPIADVQPFLDALGAVDPPTVPLLRVTKEDISCLQPLYLFGIAAED